jgi:hypothetical protein
MLQAIRSYFVSLKASAAFGRATRLRNKNMNNEALTEARIGLELLNKPFIFRFNPSESSVLSNLTVLVEQLATETNSKGASLKDLQDSLLIIKSLQNDQTASAWVTYLEASLAKTK